MATAYPFDEIFTKEVDESKYNAVLGSLESQLSSPTIRDSSQTVSQSPIMTNHVGGIKYSGGQHSNSPSPQHRVDSKIDNRPLVRANVPNINGSRGNMIGSVNFSSINSMVTPVTGSYIAKSQISQHNSVVNNPHVISNQGIIKSEIGYRPKSTVSHLQVNSSPGPVLHSSPGPPGQGIPRFSTGASNIRMQGDVKPQVVVNVVNTGNIQRPQVFIKQDNKNQPQLKREVKQEYTIVSQSQSTMASHSHSPVNVINSALRTTSFPNPTSNVVTFQRPVSTHPQPVTVVRPANTTQFSTVPNTGLHNVVQHAPARVAVANSNLTRTIAPRITTGGPLRIAPQQQVMMPVRQPGPSNMITLPQGLQLPQGTMLMKNADGQFVMVANQANQGNQQVNQKMPNVRHGMPAASVSGVGMRHPSMVPMSVPNPATMRPPNMVASGIPGMPSPVQHMVQQTLTQPPADFMEVRQKYFDVPDLKTLFKDVDPSQIFAFLKEIAAPPSKETVFESMKKCKNFLQTLIKLATNQPKDTVENVKRLIQQLIDGKIEPELFTAKLQVELNSSPQPYLVPFLKKSLPMLRLFLIQNKTRIDGVRPPPHEVMQRHPIPNLPLGSLGVPQAAGGGLQQGGGMVAQVGGAQQVSAPQMAPKQFAPAGQVGAGGVRQFTPQQIQQIRMQQQQQQQLHNLQVSKGVAPATQTKALLTRPSVATTTLSNRVVHTAGTSRVMSHSGLQTTGGLHTMGGLHTTGGIHTAGGLHTKSLAGLQQISTPTTHKAEKRKYDSTIKDGDDDINDVATMGGVNLSEESRNILATSSEIVSGQMRSCKDDTFLCSQALHSKINQIARRHGLEDCPPDVVNLVSHATQERLRNLLERLAVTAEHRLEVYRTDKKYEVKSDPRSQMKFLEELDQMEKKHQDEVEREVLIRAAKSRSKTEDPEQAKLKEKAKAMQQAELEEMRQKEANLTALAAIGPRKKRKLEEAQGSAGAFGSASSSSGSRTNVNRPRIKRVNLRDLMFLLEQERESNKSQLLYRAYLK